MSMTAFLRGVCVGMVAGAMMDMAAHPGPKAQPEDPEKLYRYVRPRRHG